MSERRTRWFTALTAALVLAAGLFGPAPAAKADFAIYILPNPLVLVSDGFFLDQGYQTASTSAGGGAWFIQDFGGGEFNLVGFPTSPLGLPYDTWFWFDTGFNSPPYYYVGGTVFYATDGFVVRAAQSTVILIGNN